VWQNVDAIGTGDTPSTFNREQPMAPTSAYVTPVLLLLASNVFMTFAWYGHLKFKASPLWIVIAASWLIALPEYLLQVPANRMGHAVYSAAQLKTIQEILTLCVFVVFSVTYLGESIRWNHLAGFALIVLAAALIFWEP
jgi:uncharacterized protein (DUF486 family)